MNRIRLFLPILALVSFSLLSFKATDKYFEIVKNLDIFSTMFKEVNAYYVDEVNPSKLMRVGMDAMLESLDPYTTYIPEDDIEDYRTNMTGQYGGIGSVIGKRNNKCLILMPYEGFPAFKAGLKIGDEILEVDGINVIGKEVEDITKLLKGQAGTKVNIKVKRFGVAENIDVSLTREKIKIKNVPYFGMVSPTTGYLKLSEFTTDASEEIKKAIQELKNRGATSLIIDLRGNPGGLLYEAIKISNLFINKGKLIVQTKGKVSEWNKTYNAEDIPLDLSMPLVVLVNGRSASASEIVSGVIQDYDRGVIIGQNSFGKGLVQATRPLSYNSQLKVTTAKYYTPSGRCIQAIDYANRDKEGHAIEIADSMRKTFYTEKKRPVLDGDGIMPDLKVEISPWAQITSALYVNHFLFDYATEYWAAHKEIPSAAKFSLSDAEYQAFVTWMQDKDLQYTSNALKRLDELDEVAKKEKYYESIKAQSDALRDQLKKGNKEDLITFKGEIREALEEEIVSRYYFQQGMIEASFDNDQEVLKAIEVLSNPTQYQKILSAP
jgi:carboxyl-terminal processing protease